MKLKHIKNLTDTQAEIILFDEIGVGNAVGSEIAAEISWLVDHNNVKEIIVRINSGGGSMVEGFGIFSALFNAREKGVNIVVSIEGLAASMAGMIAMVGNHIKMLDFGLLMIHDPNIDKEVTPEVQVVLDKFKDSAIIMMANRTGKSKHEISELMSVETWLNADEALADGFINEIVSTTISNKIKDATHLEYMDICMSISKKQNLIDMEKITAHFKLADDASQDEVLGKIKADADSKAVVVAENKTLKETAATHATDIAAKDAKIAELEAKAKESGKSTVKSLLGIAAKSGKIKKDSVDALTEKFSGDVEGVESFLEAIEDPKVNVMSLIDLSKKNDKDDDTPDMGMREMEKSDPKKLENIRNNQPELYAKMFRAQYGTDYKKG